MQGIGEFKKVSFEEFKKEFEKSFQERNPADIRSLYEKIRLPERATTGSAGYDFYLPEDIILDPGASLRIPTGIRVRMDEGWVLLLFPRSGLGFRYRLRLDNTVGVIDSDYYDSDNEGHILVSVSNETNKRKVLSLKAGSAFVQGVFVPFGTVVNDAPGRLRNGGFGSTSV
ncbi:MAG: deoxyuridine 5'-triphosphate nucleotidohydrolase [Lachnospiraceae bacterium]|nr:deoxyuridine 5'-triphosphate nucleotidohydrolase [Lachnospiraceae bacterium]